MASPGRGKAPRFHRFDLAKLPVDGPSPLDASSSGAIAVGPELQPHWDVLSALPAPSSSKLSPGGMVLTQVKAHGINSQGEVGRSTLNSQIKKIVQNLEAAIHHEDNQFFKHQHCVIDIVSTLPFDSSSSVQENRIEEKTLSIVHRGNWETAMGPIFGQFSISLLESFKNAVQLRNQVRY